MLDWVERLDELHHHLSTCYQVDDHQAVDVLLAALIEVPRTPSVWMVMETNWYARYFERAWFSFGSEWRPDSLGELRSVRPRAANEQIRTWLEKPGSRLLVEADFERLPHYQKIPESVFLLNRSLRVRVVTPRTVGVLAVDARDEERRVARLRALTRAVMEDRVGARPADPPVFRQPRDFAYRAELLERLSSWYSDWGELLNALAALTVHHAYLRGASETDERDWEMLKRVMADSVPPWITRAVRYLGEEAMGSKGQEASVKRGRSDFRGIRSAMRLEAHDADSGTVAELYRLRERGLIHWRPKKMEWIMVTEHAAGIRDVVSPALQAR